MMRVYTGQIGTFFPADAINNSVHRNCSDELQRAGAFTRADTAVISPQGKSASLLANLMRQRELIQMNKEALVKRTLDDENGCGSAGLREQLEEYKKQLDKLDEQIAAEMAKQAENTDEKDSTYQNTKDMAAAENEEAPAQLAQMSARLENTEKAEQVRREREGEKRVCETEIELGGSVAAEQKLDRINQLERLTSQIMPVVQRFMDK